MHLQVKNSLIGLAPVLPEQINATVKDKNYFFSYRTKVKREERAFSPVDSKASSESELILKAQEQYLTTILERTEVNTLETLERVRKAEAITGPPPVHARVRVVGKTHVSDTSELESESEYSQAATDISDYYHDKLQVLSYV